MNKNILAIFFVFVFLFISGCKPGQLLGPKPTSTPLPTATPDPISDEEFSALAKEACQVFKNELDSIDKNTNVLSERARLASTAYLSLAKSLDFITVIEDFAPQAFKMQSNLNSTSEAGVVFADDFDKAFSEVEISQGELVIFTLETGEMQIVNFGSGEVLNLPISPTVVTNWYGGIKTINEAAEALGLTDCINN